MEEQDITFIVSKETLSSIFKENIKSEGEIKINYNLCMGRIWNKGYGGQCSHKQVKENFCLLHFKQFINDKLTHGRIDMPCPKKLPKQHYKN